MNEMIVNAPEVKRLVDEYDFMFVSGMMMPVTVDVEAGDRAVFSDDRILIRLTAKPSLNDPEKKFPAENITIFTKHLLSLQHREREIVDLTPEQKFEWKDTILKATKTVQ